MITALQEQLAIPRDLAAAMARQALSIQGAGYYITNTGRRVDISIAMSTAVQGTVTYPPEMSLPISAAGYFNTAVEIANATTLAAASSLIDRGFHPVVLNMASAISPGGGFLGGARAQEEYLARSSTLYTCLKGNLMYSADFSHNPFYADYVIYSPEVVIFRDDDGELLEKPYLCSIVTSPAVNAAAVHRYMPHRTGEIENAMWNRILKLFSVSLLHGHKALVLGAWGCGAFGNDGYMVASLFRTALTENFQGAFERVAFAIADWSPEQDFIGPFLKTFSQPS